MRFPTHTSERLGDPIVGLDVELRQICKADLGGKASDEICNMSKPVVEVQVRAVAAVSGGCAVKGQGRMCRSCSFKGGQETAPETKVAARAADPWF